MSEATISPLRRRMIEDMTVRNFSADTQRNYIRGVKNLAIFLGRSPDTATPEELRLFQLHLTENRVRPPTINATLRLPMNTKKAAAASFPPTVPGTVFTREAKVMRRIGIRTGAIENQNPGS